MFIPRKANDRGHSNIGWLNSWHTFSFSDYYDPAHMGFRSLRVINDDIVAPGMGFGTHPHRDMEIITYVLSGALQHKDSLGNGDILRPGDVQRMSAGTGIRHSEFNPSPGEPVHLLQIWIEPSSLGGPASYEQKHFTAADRTDRWRRVVDNTGSDGALRMNADAVVSAAIINPGKSLHYTLGSARHAWLHVAHGAVRIGENVLVSGDALAVNNENDITVQADKESELLLFDLA